MERSLSTHAERGSVPDAPQTLVLRRHRDLEGRHYEAHARRALLMLIGLVPLLALFNVFGQHPQSARASTPAATLTVSAPTRARSGLIYSARFRIDARQELKHATIVLDPSWADGYTVNGVAPQFLFILLITRVVGRRELSSLEPFDVILLVVMGDLIQQGVTQADTSTTGIMIAVGVFGLMTVATSYASFRFKRLRPVLDGEPVILLQDGKLIDRNLRNERMTVEEVAQEARLQQIASLDQVAWAVLESTGQISFIPKSR
jgi:hypothetical protein